MNEITLSIIERVKAELKIEKDLTALELYMLLNEYRKTQHPDKFTSEESIKTAEETFKRLSPLLEELNGLIEIENQDRKPIEIIKTQKDYEIVRTNQQIINYEETIKQLKHTIELNESSNKSLKNQINKLQGEKTDQKINDLIKHYKPSKKSLLSHGITFFLTLIIATITKTDEVATIIMKYSPFDKIYLNYIFFCILVLTPLSIIKSFFEKEKIEKTANRIRTPKLINKFWISLSEKDSKETFTEMDVYEFINLELSPKYSFTEYFRKHIYDLYDEIVINTLKDIFIYNLLNKQLITISSAEKLDRKFKIVKSHSYFSTDFDIEELD